jgi:hypothetical protein
MMAMTKKAVDTSSIALGDNVYAEKGVTPEKEDLGLKATEAMKLRFRYSYHIGDFMFNLLCPMKSAFFCKKFNRPMNFKYRYDLYEKGSEKYVNEFDAVEYAKSSRMLNTMISSLMDRQERFFVNYQKNNCISIDGEDSFSGNSTVPSRSEKENVKLKHEGIINGFMVIIINLTPLGQIFTTRMDSKTLYTC